MCTEVVFPENHTSGKDGVLAGYKEIVGPASRLGYFHCPSIQALFIELSQLSVLKRRRSVRSEEAGKVLIYVTPL